MRFRFISLYLVVTLGIFGIISCTKIFAATPDSLLVNVSSPNPAPNETVNITLNSYANNLDTVLISWSVDGKKSLSGVGKKSFSLTAGAAGSSTLVKVAVMLPEGELDQTITIRPAVMALLWQADDSYVPPFYEGKALPTSDSEIKVVAMPEIKSKNGTISDPNNMSYTWQQDYNNDAGASGYGKNFYTYTSDYLDNSNNIAVTATTIDGSYSSDANIDITTTTPKIDFYKNDSLMGTLWEQALTDGHQVQGAEMIQAEPYFISPKDIRIPSLTWTWSVNGQEVPVAIFTKNIFPIKAPVGVTGTSQLTLTIDSLEKVFETATKTINVQF